MFADLSLASAEGVLHLLPTESGIFLPNSELMLSPETLFHGGMGCIVYDARGRSATASRKSAVKDPPAVNSEDRPYVVESIGASGPRLADDSVATSAFSRLVEERVYAGGLLSVIDEWVVGVGVSTSLCRGATGLPELDLVIVWAARDPGVVRLDIVAFSAAMTESRFADEFNIAGSHIEQDYGILVGRLALW